MKSFLEIIKEEESSGKHHVMTFGRMNPPTTGHMKLINKVHEVAQKHNASHSVVTSHSQDSKKNPLSPAQKKKHLQRYSPETNFVSASKEEPTILHHAAKLHKKGVTHLHVVVGSDRVKEMHGLLHKYNGVPGKHGHYHFKKITVTSAGHRDPDSEGSEGMSGTKMREHAKNKNHGEFRKGVPSHVSDQHSKELMHDVRKGMGLHENANHGLFKAIFVTGGPGSGKDVIIREAIAESNAVEMNSIQIFDYLANKQKLSEKSNDVRLEAIRNRNPLIINGPADDIERITHIKEELEDLGYQTIMVFVDTTNEASKERNEKLSRMMVESVRHDKWLKSQKNKQYFQESFKNFVYFDNNGTLDSIEEDITQTYLNINEFIESKSFNDVAINWLENKGKLNRLGIVKEEKNVKSVNRFIQVKKNKGLGAPGPADITADNRASEPASGDLKWNGGKGRGSYIFRTYTEEKGITLTKKPEPKEANFSKDKEKDKIKKRYTDSPTVNQRLRNVTGVGPEFDTRQQGTVYPMSGLGDVTYREQKEFSSFRKQLNEYQGFINQPAADDMGVGGTLGGSTNKEPMQSYKDSDKNVGIQITNKKKKKQEK
jgi:predicted kinase